MIYAKVDVKLRDHERAHRAGNAMSTWLWALLYSREQETDGYIADAMIRLAWAGEAEARKHARKLIEVELWEADAERGGWRVCRYSDKNETRSSIAVRRAEAADRMTRVRANRMRTPSPCSSEHPPNTRSVDRTAVPGSGSGSGSVISDPEIPEEIHSAREVPDSPPLRPLAVVPDPSGPPPDWWDLVLATIHASVGVALASGECWLAYAGHRHGKRLPATREDALQWLVQVMVPKARKAADEARRQRDRDAKFDAERRAEKAPSPAPYHATSRRKPSEPIDLAETMRAARERMGGALFAVPDLPPTRDTGTE